MVGFFNTQKGKNSVRFCTEVPVTAFEQLGILEFKCPNILLSCACTAWRVSSCTGPVLSKGFSSLELETNIRISVMIKVSWGDGCCYKNVRKTFYPFLHALSGKCRSLECRPCSLSSWTFGYNHCGAYSSKVGSIGRPEYKESNSRHKDLRNCFKQNI